MEFDELVVNKESQRQIRRKKNFDVWGDRDVKVRIDRCLVETAEGIHDFYLRAAISDCI